jgi:glycosyltransferase involved in cell wall biosynthesis
MIRADDPGRGSTPGARRAKRVALVSRLALYPQHWAAFSCLCRECDVVEPTIVMPVPPTLPSVHQSLGWIRCEQALAEVPGLRIVTIEDTSTWRQALRVFHQVRHLDADAVWVQEEPSSWLTLVVLLALRWRTRPRIVVAACENIFPRWGIATDWLRRWLWRRVDTIAAVADASIDGLHAAGFPRGVETATLVAGNFPPPENLDPLPLPFERPGERFIACFAGRVCEEKGIHPLLVAMRALPDNICLVIAGDGPLLPEVDRASLEPSLLGRIHLAGLLPKEELWRLYAACHCLILPSLTTPRWKEQFGGVLADAMALGLPIVGSDSGAIPQVVGDAGILCQEGDAAALVAALSALASDESLRNRLRDAGRERFTSLFDIDSYAAKLANCLRLGPKDRRLEDR